MLRIKGNLAREVPGLAYRIVDSKIKQDAKLFVGKVEWEEGTKIHEKPDEILQPLLEEGSNRFARTEAKEWLRALLMKGKLPKRDIQDAAEKNGHSWGTVRNAGRDLGILHVSDGHGRGSVTYWKLPKGALCP